MSRTAEKVVVLADPETFFLPHLVARLAQASCVQAIVLRCPPFRVRRFVRDLRRGLTVFGVLTFMGTVCHAVLARLAALVFPHRHFSLVQVARRFGLRLYRVPRVHGAELRDILDKEHADLVFSQVGVKLRRELLERATFINKHCSPLPSYAGVYPVFWAMLRGEETLGVTIHVMTEKYDAGPILRQRRIPSAGHTFFSAYHALYDEAATMLIEWLHDHRSDGAPCGGQDSYFSYPCRKDRATFLTKGCRFGLPLRLHADVRTP